MKKPTDFIGSFKFAFTALVVIIILSIVGSLVPSGDHDAVVAKLTSIFGGYADSVLHFLEASGFINIYSSPIFVFFIFLFALSTAVRTYKLLPFAFKGFNASQVHKFDNVTETNLTEAEIFSLLKKKGWKIFPKSGSKEVFKISKHAFGRFGVIILHVGILVVMLGALIGYVWGFNGFMNILEGDSDDVAVLPDGKLQPLGFEVACDNFNVEYYDNSTRAKAYTSLVSVKENGKTVKTASIDVNHPLKYNDVVFYQTTFGLYPNKGAKAIFSIETKNGVKEYKEGFDSLFKIDGDYVGKITDFAPNLSADDEGRIFSASQEMLNPAALMEIYDKDKPVLRAWILKNNPLSGDFKDLGFKIKFDDLWGAQYTGLSVKKDPGTPLIYIGFLLIGLGVILTYLLNYTAVFFEIDERGDRRFINYILKEQRKRRIINPADGFNGLFVKKSEKEL